LCGLTASNLTPWPMSALHSIRCLVSLAEWVTLHNIPPATWSGRFFSKFIYMGLRTPSWGLTIIRALVKPLCGLLYPTLPCTKKKRLTAHWISWIAEREIILNSEWDFLTRSNLNSKSFKVRPWWQKAIQKLQGLLQVSDVCTCVLGSNWPCSTATMEAICTFWNTWNIHSFVSFHDKIKVQLCTAE
jgi:hypothetical protein